MVIVEPPAVNTPLPVIVNKVPDVPVRLIAELLAVSVPVVAMLIVVAERDRLVPSLVLRVPLMVSVLSAVLFTFIVIVSVDLIVTLSVASGTCPQSQVPVVFQFPLVTCEVQSNGDVLKV